MAESFIPVTTSNLSNQTSITNVIDQNFAKIQTILNDVLARGGTSPNTMQSTLDMNSNQIINLPSPGTANSPVRLVDINSTATATPAIVAGNNVYTGNNSFTGTNSFGVISVSTITGTVGFTTINTTTLNVSAVSSSAGSVTITGFHTKGPIYDIVAYGAVGDNATDNYAAISTTIAAAGSGAIVFIPPGVFHTSSSINVPSDITILGSGRLASQITCNTFSTSNDFTVLNIPATTSRVIIEKLGIFGNSTTSAVGTVVQVGFNSEVTFRDLDIWGGLVALSTSGADGTYDNCYITSKGNSGFCVLSHGANWYIRCKLDPALNNAYSFSQGAYTAGGVAENHFTQCDFTSSTTNSACVSFDIEDNSTATAITTFDGCVFGNTTKIGSARFTMISACEFAGGSGSFPYTGGTGGPVCITGSIAFNTISGLSSAAVIISGCYNIS